MNGGARYWNEETQRWEDDGGTRALSAPPTTPPPPARPEFAPVDGGASGEGAVASGGSSSGASSSDASSSGVSSSGQGAEQGAGTVPGAGGWHGPAAGGSGSGAWPATEVSAGGPAVRDPDAPVGEDGKGGGEGKGGGAAAGAGPGEPGSAPSAPSAAGGGVWPPASSGPAPGGVPGPEGGGDAAWPAAPWPGPAWPSTDPGAAPAPAQGMSRRTVWSVLIGAAAVGVAVSLVLTLVVRSGDDKKDEAVVTASSSPAVDVSQQGEPDGSPTPTEQTSSPGPTTPEVPAGYELFEDPEGFRIVRPQGWTRSTVDSQYGIAVVNYRSADSTRRLQVYQVEEESPEASFDLYLSDKTAKPDGFEQLSLDPLDGSATGDGSATDGSATGFEGARLEYLADRIRNEPDVGTWHVYDVRFVAQDGFNYAIAAYGPDANGGQDELDLVTTALNGFCAPYACDPASID
ncbi:hypothetical protein [Streptomyces sp. YU58]|uniref:hypothetical protein n=1 Tax=Streptomyces sp. SX92 TaxID=3158972 RepID=UPI0027BA3249|nr:hypothetical protein [Streptomyces coralus]WLW52751.1 hypothetical protein QU709_15750 [Streptomyces coralus]